mmetsp:Transcript_13073/g.31795  ORF Transcript_13073/g.31795 Transcript_13073/m.31795 type:complete len:121 (-) Transcript_13073:160-522(-)
MFAFTGKVDESSWKLERSLWDISTTPALLLFVALTRTLSEVTFRPIRKWAPGSADIPEVKVLRMRSTANINTQFKQEDSIIQGNGSICCQRLTTFYAVDQNGCNFFQCQGLRSASARRKL